MSVETGDTSTSQEGFLGISKLAGIPVLEIIHPQTTSKPGTPPAAPTHPPPGQGNCRPERSTRHSAGSDSRTGENWSPGTTTQSTTATSGPGKARCWHATERKRTSPRDGSGSTWADTPRTPR